MVVRYQCESMYNGTPTATCGDDGMYVVQGRCKKECGPPPVLPHASPSFDNALVSNGWIEGMRAPYICDPGYEGFVTALCGADGVYNATGSCSPSSTIEREHLLHRAQLLESNVDTLENQVKSLEADMLARQAAMRIETAIIAAFIGLWLFRMWWKRRKPRSPPLLNHANGSAAPQKMHKIPPHVDP